MFYDLQVWNYQRLKAHHPTLYLKELIYVLTYLIFLIAYDYNMIDVGDNVSICYECYEDVEACEWCGDYVFGAELVERGLYKVCSLCTNDVSNTLYLPEANGIVSA